MFPTFKIAWVTHCLEQHAECFHYSVFMKYHGKHYKLAQLNNVKRGKYWKILAALFKQRHSIYKKFRKVSGKGIRN